MAYSIIPNKGIKPCLPSGSWKKPCKGSQSLGAIRLVLFLIRRAAVSYSRKNTHRSLPVFFLFLFFIRQQSKATRCRFYCANEMRINTACATNSLSWAVLDRFSNKQLEENKANGARTIQPSIVLVFPELGNVPGTSLNVAVLQTYSVIKLLLNLIGCK